MEPATLGDRQKMYEMAECGRSLMPKLPAMARLDGRAFHTFTRDMDRPFDAWMTRFMVETTRYLVQETNACLGYTQSDEITLCWYSADLKSQIFFDGRIQKMVSTLAGLATLQFNLIVQQHPRGDALLCRRPQFDCRVWNVPTLEEAANVFLWREQDATRNSLSMLAQAHFSHHELQGKDSPAMQDMLHGIGVNWNDLPSRYKRGSYVQRRRVSRTFDAALDDLPPKHAARTNPNLMVERWQVENVEMPPFGRVANRVAVVFEGSKPFLMPKWQDVPELVETVCRSRQRTAEPATEPQA